MFFSLNDKHIIIKYHYIENLRENRGAFHPCSVAEFEKQITFLKNNFQITSVENVFEAAQNNSQEKLCALTFDDGLLNQYKNAVPILDAHKIQGAFFPITKTLEGFLPATHAMHILLSLQDGEKLADMFNSFLETLYPELLKRFGISTIKRVTTLRKMYDDVPTANIKETMNHLPRAARDAFIKNMLHELGQSERALSQELFMSKEDIRTLYGKGHSIGSHSHTHEAFDTLDTEEIRKEISMSKKTLEEIISEPISLLVYPQSAPQKTPYDILKKNGIHFALGTERRGVSKTDSPHCIPRYDANDIRDFLNLNEIH